MPIGGGDVTDGGGISGDVLAGVLLLESVALVAAAPLRMTKCPSALDGARGTISCTAAGGTDDIARATTTTRGGGGG